METDFTQYEGFVNFYETPVFSTLLKLRNRLAQVAYRSGSASPSGSVTPQYIGEDYFDASAKKWYRSTGTADTDWAALN